MTDASDSAASEIIAAFGGIRPMAHRLGVPVSTVQGWKQRDSIPQARMEEIREAAAGAGIALPDASGPGHGKTADDTQESRDTGMSTQDETNADTGPGRGHDDRAGTSPATGATSGEDAAPDAAPSPRPARREARGPAMLAGLALIVALAIGGWVWWTTEGPGAANQATADPGREARESLGKAITELRDQMRATAEARSDMGPVQDRLDALASGLAALRESQARGGSDRALVGMVAELGEEQAGLTDRVAELSAAVERLQARLDDATARIDAIGPAQAERAELDDRVSALEQTEARRDEAMSDAIALSLAASQLRRSIDQGEPYSEALATARAVADDQAGVGGPLGVLAAYAGKGVPTPETLRLEFPEVARDALKAADMSSAGSWGERILQRAGELVSVRRTGPDVEGEGPEARLARAEYHLEAGNIARAVDEVSALDGAPGEAVQPWLERARALRDVEGALAAIERIALSRLREAAGE